MGNVQKKRHIGQFKSLDGAIVKAGEAVYRWEKERLVARNVERITVSNHGSAIYPNDAAYSSAEAFARHAIFECLRFIGVDSLKSMVDEVHSQGARQ